MMRSTSGKSVVVTSMLVAAVLLLVGLAGCGSGGGGPKTLFVVGLGTPDVQRFSVNVNTGVLTADATNLVATGSAPAAIAVDGQQKFAFVANSASGSSNGTVSQYTINGNGVLAVANNPNSTTTIAAVPVPVGVNPVALVVEPSNHYVYVANNLSNTISAFSIDGSSGFLTEISGSPFATGTRPNSVAAANGFLFVANTNSTTSTGQISVYSINSSTGALTAVSGSPFAAGQSLTSLDVDSGGKFLYASDAAANGVLAYTVSSAGALTAVSGSPFAAGTSPVNVRLKGSVLFVANIGSNNVSVYVADSGSGGLTPVSGSPFATGKSPSCVLPDTSGRLLFVANSGDNTISSFQIGSTGPLTAVGGSPFTTFAATPIGMATVF